MHAGHYAGSQVFLSNVDGPLEVQSRPVQDVAADWLEGEPTTVATWQRFAHEAGAADYASFLDRLRGTVNYGNEAFRQVVAEDLRQAAVRPRLREQYFELASGANASCEDRITLAWNGMQTARLNADVEDGVYDGRVGELLRHAPCHCSLGSAGRNRVREGQLASSCRPGRRTSMRSRSTLHTRPSCVTLSSCGTSLPTCGS
ncbi:NEL-type E3 ubiquitin ligase domain-containing protein [Bradyrhizobium sp. NBAIM01]|uniref:NEL-type E3 ubiquitin ligase domain-containing protein n=1 Tax=Bradyrhizobium sp. NBAIM01 TaxID=2793818 RepID=UPI0023EF3180|nr:NEL-type E3 ubiquitin ligase domain-containing protein [Bradyrhizobium sp. NBAIM01]